MEYKEKNFISAVIYVHNAEYRIEKFLKSVMEVLQENFEHSEIICVNDHSEDSSVDVIKRISTSAVNTSVTILNMSYYHGVEMAMNAGVDFSIGDFVFEFDTVFLDYDKSEIMCVYRKAIEGYDIVSASSNRKQKFMSRIFYKVLYHFGNFSAKMYTESFRILSRRVINRISSMNKTVPYRKAVYMNCGLKTENLTYDACDNSLNDGIDKIERRYKWNLAVDNLLLFTDIGYQFSEMMTFLMMIIAAFMVIYSLMTYLFGNPVEGWTTTILFLSAAFGGLFGIISVVIKYLQILVNLVFKRKRYSFESIEKLAK